MKLRKLGRTNLLVSEIGFGAWAISGIGYGPTDDIESIRTLHRALDLGVNIIDTADSYGNGHSEELIGRVLKERGDKETIITTKVGWDFYRKNGIRGNLKREYIFFALEHSLKRLKRDWIDIYQVHLSKPDSLVNLEVYETMDELKTQGKIRFYGVSASYARDGIAAIATGKPDIIQIAYNMLEQEAEKELFPLAMKNEIGIIAREPLACGLLTGNYNENSLFLKSDHRRGWSKSYLMDSMEKVKKLMFLKSQEKTLIQASLRFCLSHEAVSAVIPGAKRVYQVEENIGSTKVQLSSKELENIKEIYINNFEE